MKPRDPQPCLICRGRGWTMPGPKPCDACQPLRVIADPSPGVRTENDNSASARTLALGGVS